MKNIMNVIVPAAVAALGVAGLCAPVAGAAEAFDYAERFKAIPADAQFPYADPFNNGWTTWSIDDPLTYNEPGFFDSTVDVTRVITTDLDFTARPLICAHERWMVATCFRGGRELPWVLDQTGWKGTFVDMPAGEQLPEQVGSSLDAAQDIVTLSSHGSSRRN